MHYLIYLSVHGQRHREPLLLLHHLTAGSGNVPDGTLCIQHYMRLIQSTFTSIMSLLELSVNVRSQLAV